MVRAGIVAVGRNRGGGLIMRRGIAIAAAGLSLAGCPSFSFDAFRSKPLNRPAPARLGAGHAQPLIAWTAPHGGLYAEPIMPRLRVAETRARADDRGRRNDKAC